MLAGDGEQPFILPLLPHVFATAQLQTKPGSAKRVDFGTACLYCNIALGEIS